MVAWTTNTGLRVRAVRHIPNLICLIRIALVWPVAVSLESHQFPTALGLFVIAGMSDALDGYLAKHFKWQSELPICIQT